MRSVKGLVRRFHVLKHRNRMKWDGMGSRIRKVQGFAERSVAGDHCTKHFWIFLSPNFKENLK